MKEASLIREKKLQVRIAGNDCRARHVEACWMRDEFLASNPPQVEFFVTHGAEEKVCTGPIKEQVRVFELSSVNARVERCQADGHRILCVVSW